MSNLFRFDVYDPNVPYYGNTNLKANCSDGNNYLDFIDPDTEGVDLGGTGDGKVLDWLFTVHMDQDLRMGFVEIDCDSNLKVKQSITFGECLVFQISPISNRPVCYTTEALKYAQTSFFFSIVITQFSNCKFPHPLIQPNPL